MSIHTYDVPGISCTSCAQLITGALNKTPFKQCAREIDVTNQKLILYLNEEEEAFQALETASIDELVFSALQDVGFDEVISKGATKKKKPYSHAFWGAVGLFSGALLLLLPVLFSTIPFALLGTLSLLSTALTLILGFPFYRRAYHGVWQGAWTMDTLFSVSTGVILGVSLSALFFPALPMMFESGLLIFGFRHLGIAIADAFKANLLSIRRFQDDVPQFVMCKKKKAESFEHVALDKIAPGDMIKLSPGDILPVDGVFDAGEGMVSSLYQTGSYHAKPIKIDQCYPAGTKLVSQSAPLLFRAKATANHSFLAREDRAVLQSKLNRALEKKKPALNSVAYWLQYFVPIVFAVAAVSGMAVGFYFGSVLLAMQCAVSVLVAACPCTLGLIAPLVTHIGIKKIEETGISVRESSHLEMAVHVNCVVFDINGTLTDGMPEVVRKPDDEALLALMAHLEQGTDHWVAHAIRQAAKSLPKDLPKPRGRCKPMPSTHNSHQVLFDKKTYTLGDSNSMLALGIDSKLLEVKVAAMGESVVYLAENGKLKGHIVIEDKIREGALEVVRALQTTMGKKVYLCTGSDAKTAQSYATALNIPLNQVFSDCTVDGENSKQAHLKALKKKGYQVAMIGDAGNDARAIAECFGLAVAHEGGHTGTQQGASAVLQTGALFPILDLFKIARQTAIHIHQNVWFSFAYNLLAMLTPPALLLGAGVVLSPAIGAGLMILQTLLIFANVYRFKQTKAPAIEQKKTVRPETVLSPSEGMPQPRIDLTPPLLQANQANALVEDIRGMAP